MFIYSMAACNSRKIIINNMQASYNHQYKQSISKNLESPQCKLANFAQHFTQCFNPFSCLQTYLNYKQFLFNSLCNILSHYSIDTTFIVAIQVQGTFSYKYLTLIPLENKWCYPLIQGRIIESISIQILVYTLKIHGYVCNMSIYLDTLRGLLLRTKGLTTIISLLIDQKLQLVASIVSRYQVVKYIIFFIIKYNKVYSLLSISSKNAISQHGYVEDGV